MLLAAAPYGGLVAIALLVPLALKWRLPLRVVVAWALLSGSAFGVLASLVLGAAPSAVWLAAEVLLLAASSAAAAAGAFFRDPERVPPDDPAAIVSPADGEVLYVRPFAGDERPPIVKRGLPLDVAELAGSDPAARGQVIGIGMHLLNVHVNRAPLAGDVRMVVRVPGRFLSLRQPEAIAANERVTTVIENEGATVGVVQIASRLVRRIVTYVEQGSAVAAGQRIGMIRFGSQVDLVLPDADVASVSVRPGDKVRAGETVIARLEQRVASGSSGKGRWPRPADPEGLEALSD